MGRMEDKIKRQQQIRNLEANGGDASALRDEQRRSEYKPGQVQGLYAGSTARARVLDPATPRRSAMEDWAASQTFTKTKYVVVDHPKVGEIAIVFPGCLTHSEMARSSYLREGPVVGAGFVWLGTDKAGQPTASVYERSESLNIGNRGELDEAVILKSIGLSD